jgi:cephalosporin hydroxylase
MQKRHLFSVVEISCRFAAPASANALQSGVDSDHSFDHVLATMQLTD